MSECELTSSCIFFNDKMANRPGTADLLKSIYCKDEPNNCARMIVVKALGRSKVPADLFPNQAALAVEIIKKG